jgi:hypothetical protein
MRALSLGFMRFIVPLLVKVIINACLLFMLTGLPVGLTCSITIHLKITNRDTNGMPKFLDVHSLKGLDEEALRKTQNSPKDEFGVTHDNILLTKKKISFFVFWMLQVKRQWRNIMRNMVSSVTGLQKLKQPQLKLR